MRQTVKTLDPRDRKLLALLRENARMPTAALARKLGVARTTVVERLKRLERDGIVSGYTVRMHPRANARMLQVHVLLNVDTKKAEAVVTALRSMPQVRAVYAISGSFDCLAFVEGEALRGRGDVLFFGGPVSRQQLFVVFRAASLPEDATELVEGVYMSMSAAVMRELAASGAAPDRFRVFAGYAGWAPSQLEAEIGRGDWHLAKPEAATIFAAKPGEVWRELFRRASAVKARYFDFLQRYQPTTLSAAKSVSMNASSPSFERFTSSG